MRHLFVLFIGLATLLAGLPPAAEAAPAQAAGCQYTLGFKTLHDMIPSVVGNCVTDEQHAANGDGLQQSTNGLLVWRKADNFTAFTDGFHTWVNGPQGLQERLNTQRFDWEKNAKVSSTEVITFTPPTTTSNTVSGNCFSTSIASTRSDAWRCMAGNVIYDPCFSIPNNTKQVVCVRNPLEPSNDVTMNLTQPLPAAQNVASQDQHPWFLQLADGTFCNFFTGATGGVNGERINYGCSDGWVIVGNPQTGTVWTAQEVFLAPMSTTVEKSAKVELAKVWE